MPTAIIPTMLLYEHIRSICEKMKIAASLSKADYFHSIFICLISISVDKKYVRENIFNRCFNTAVVKQP
jgi:hypothetical protein